MYDASRKGAVCLRQQTTKRSEVRRSLVGSAGVGVGGFSRASALFE